MDLKKVVESFFRNIGAEPSWKGELLNVKNVPSKFEAFYGKKSPYCFAFEEKDVGEGIELIQPGCFLLKVISNFLDSKPKTTLLKLDLKVDHERDVKNNFKINHCEIASISAPYDLDYVWRFTFATIFQYLNEREKAINSVYVHDGEVIDNFFIEDYSSVPGKKKDIEEVDTKKQYLVAQEKIKSVLKEKTKEVGLALNKSLEKELNRIEEHCKQQLSEINEAVYKHEEKIIELKRKLEKSPDDLETQGKIFRIEELIEKKRDYEEISRIEKEREFLINDEKNRHSLNVKTSLMNTSIIYYPIYNLRVYLKKKGRLQKPVEIRLNPLTKKIQPIFCDSCKKLSNEINICSSGHVLCNNCVSSCDSCREEICGKCRTWKCGICDKGICKNCSARCMKCGKYFCSNHLRKDFLSGNAICTSCSKHCFVCGKDTEREFFKRCFKCSKEMCPKCSRKETIKGVSREVCSGCSKGFGF